MLLRLLGLSIAVWAGSCICLAAPGCGDFNLVKVEIVRQTESNATEPANGRGALILEVPDVQKN
ncbi:MAG TPA: hypothetical protein VMY42_26400 [Thermoguttaceae bacterium]|nr:hypothetical protein [Thermoguttaceae bacterium]